MTKPTAVANAAGLSELCPGSRLERSAIEALSMCDLYRAASLLQACADMMAYSSLSQPLAGLISQLVDEEIDVVAIAKARSPATVDEAHWKGWIIARHDAWMSSELRDLALNVMCAAVAAQELGAKS